MAGLMAVTSIDVSGLTMYAAQAKAANEPEKTVVITEVEPLSDEIEEQTLKVGASEKKIVLPDTLDVWIGAETEETETEEPATETEGMTTEETGTEQDDEELVDLTDTTENTNVKATPAAVTITEQPSIAQIRVLFWNIMQKQTHRNLP